MVSNKQESFERCCRLCAQEQETTIMIFSAEAQAMFLLNKLNKYLLIEVDEDDKLPKNICLQCCTKLQVVCDFIDTAHKAQEELTARSAVLDNLNYDPPSTDIKKEPAIESLDQDTNFTEMEVSVDPMIVLQNSEEAPSPNSETGNESPEQITYLHNNEDVTIKLIKRGDKSCVGKNEQKPFCCLTCNRRFWTDIALKSHSWIHSEEEKKNPEHKCPFCYSCYELKSELINHLKVHRKESKCKVCGRVFRSETNLQVHMFAHLNKKSFTCKVCGRSYNTWSNLKTHSVTHSAERPFHCHICKKSFKRNQDLKFHINQHTGAKPYKCPFCDKCFASSGNCYSHRSRMHPGQKLEKKPKLVSEENKVLLEAKKISPITSIKGIFKYQCHLCDHSFLKRDNYIYHIYQHTGKKPYQCTFCSDQFVTRKGLQLHHDKEHSNKERPLMLISKNVLLD